MQPDRSKEVKELEDELALSNVEWSQSFKEIQAKMVKLEENFQGLKRTNQDLIRTNEGLTKTNEDLKRRIEDLEKNYTNDKNSIISNLLKEMINYVGNELDSNDNDNFFKRKRARNA